MEPLLSEALIRADQGDIITMIRKSLTWSSKILSKPRIFHD